MISSTPQHARNSTRPTAAAAGTAACSTLVRSAGREQSHDHRMMLLPLLPPGCASQSLPPLPGFGGLAFFQAAAAQQRGSLLPESPPPEPCAHAFSKAAAAAPAGRTTKEGWWDQAHALASELGLPVEQQPLAAVGVPRALKKLKKQAFAALCRHVEPQALPVSASSAHGGSAAQPPSLQETVCRHYADFSSGGDASGCYGSGSLLLDEAIFLAADSCWPEQSGQQWMAPLDPQQLLVPMPEDGLDPHVLAIVHTTVSALPAPEAPQTPAPQPQPISHLLQACVLAVSTKPAAAASVVRDQQEPAASKAVAGSEHEAADADAAPAVAQAASQPQPGTQGPSALAQPPAEAVAVLPTSWSPQHLKLLRLEEPALPACTWLTPHDVVTAAPPATEPLLSGLQDAIAEQRSYHAGVLAAGSDAVATAMVPVSLMHHMSAARLPPGALPSRLPPTPAADSPARASQQRPPSVSDILAGMLQAECSKARKQRKRLAPPAGVDVRSRQAQHMESGAPSSSQEKADPGVPAAAAAVDGAAKAPAAGSQHNSQQPCAPSPLGLSPNSLLVEVPICQPCSRVQPLCEGLLQQALDAAEVVLQQPSPAWDATWGELLPLPEGPDGSSDSASQPWWSGAAVLDMLSGAALQPGYQAGSAAAAAAAAANGAGTRAQLGSVLLDQLLAADMQLDYCDNSRLLPMMPLSDAADAFGTGSDSVGDSLVAQLLRSCSFQRQPTAHLELYFDWSVLQPPKHQLPSSSSGSKGKSSKRARDGGGTNLLTAAAAAGSASKQAAAEALAWLMACSCCPGLQQLQEPLQRLPRAGDTGSAASDLSTQQIAAVYSRRALAAVLLPDGAGTKPRRQGTEVAAPEVVADAAAWYSRACAASAAAAAPAPTAAAATSSGSNTAAAGQAPPASEAPASDLAFFMSVMSVHGMAKQQGIKRSSTAAAEAPGAKRPRLSAAAQPGAAGAGSEAAAEQRVLHATTDLAVNGAITGGLQKLAAGADAPDTSGPEVVSVPLPGSMLQLMRVLEASRRQLLASLPCASPELHEAPLWEDAAAQALLMQLQRAAASRAQRGGQAGGVPPEQKQQAKQLVALLLLSQTAGCLLHYGIKVAHLFLQHGLYQLPATSQACRDAAAALGGAYDALQQRPVTAGERGAGSDGSGAVQPEDHPKLHHLKNIVAGLQAQGCKVLVAAESKAFFSLHHSLSAAGIITMQLDREQLPMRGQVTEQSATVAAAWQAAAAAATSTASCVLVTHKQLQHPCMPLAAFSALVEFVEWQDTAAAAGGSSDGGLESSSTFGPGKHFVLRTAAPDLRLTAATAAEQLSAAAGQCDAAAAAAGKNDFAAEMPLLLNRASSSVLRRRPSLYQALLQLETQGFQLVERTLGRSGGSSSRPEGSAAATIAAAVDVVTSPRACICVWDTDKTPQDAEAVLQLMCRSLLALALAYDAVTFVLELPDGLLRGVIASSSHLQGLAGAVGMRLQLMCCLSAANTQDVVVALCKSTATSFWSNCMSSGESSPVLQPPPDLSDLPSAAEAGLQACAALNPLSAAVIANHGCDLRGLLELALSGEAAGNPVLAACMPPQSIQLLQAQAERLACQVQQQQHAQEQEQGLGEELQQEQWQAAWQHQQQHHHHHGDAAPGQQQQQQYEQGAANADEAPLPEFCMDGWLEEDAGGQHMAAPAPAAGTGWQQQQQQQAYGQRWQQQQALPGPDDGNEQRGSRARVAAVPQLDIDPSSVLDQFLSNRTPPPDAAAARGGGWGRSAAAAAAAGMQQPREPYTAAALGRGPWGHAAQPAEPWMPAAHHQHGQYGHTAAGAHAGRMNQQHHLASRDAHAQQLFERELPEPVWMVEPDFLQHAAHQVPSPHQQQQQRPWQQEPPELAGSQFAGEADGLDEAGGWQQQQQGGFQPPGDEFDDGNVMPGRGPDARPGSMFGAAAAQPRSGPAIRGSSGGGGVHSRGVFGTGSNNSGSRPRAAALGASAARQMASAVDASDDDSRLSAPSFMPHRQPTRQLKYARPEGVKKAKRGGGPRKGRGMFHQTQLCWG